MVSSWDDVLGNVIEKLKSKGIYDNTLIIVSSDNGGPIYDKWPVKVLVGGGNNYPLKGGKMSSFEGGVRVV